MSDTPRDIGRKHYWCFISYRHADNQTEGRLWATWLHRQLETYSVPTTLVGQTNLRGETIPARIFPVFRDEDELPADADLSTPIIQALERSHSLVVLCSPRARRSRFVDDEVRLFKSMGKSARILGAILAGDPGQPHAPLLHSEESCLPPSLCHAVDTQAVMGAALEPASLLDLRTAEGEEGWTDASRHRSDLISRGTPADDVKLLRDAYAERLEDASLRIFAHVLGLEHEVLRQHHDRQQASDLGHRRRSFALWTIAGLALLSLAAGAYRLSIDDTERGSKARGEAATQQRLSQARQAEAAAAQAKLRKSEAEALYSQGSLLLKSVRLFPERLPKATSLIVQAAEMDFAPAQHRLAAMLTEGQGMPSSPNKAAEWLHKAAAHGYNPARTSLGLAYLEGKSVARKPEEAVRQFGQAAENGDSEAMYHLAQCLIKGTGAKADRTKGLRWMIKSAESGEAQARLFLSLGYRYGAVVKKDPAEALRWTKLLAESGDAAGRRELGIIYRYGQGVPADSELAAHWLQLAIEKQDAVARTELRALFDDEKATPTETRAAHRWHFHLAFLGYARSMNQVGEYFRDGVGVEKADAVRAFGFFQQAANKGYARAKYNLGDAFGRGLGTEIDRAKESRFKKEAVAQAGSDAAFRYYVGSLQLRTLKAGESRDEALRWLGLAADQNHPGAQLLLSSALLDGERSPARAQEALRWALIAQGNKEAEADKLAARAALLLTPDQRKTAEKAARGFLEKKKSSR